MPRFRFKSAGLARCFNASSAPSAEKRRTSHLPQGRHSLLLPLEPRLVFDGAAVATGVEIVTDIQAHIDAAAHPAPDTVADGAAHDASADSAPHVPAADQDSTHSPAHDAPDSAFHAAPAVTGAEHGSPEAVVSALSQDAGQDTGAVTRAVAESLAAPDHALDHAPDISPDHAPDQTPDLAPDADEAAHDYAGQDADHAAQDHDNDATPAAAAPDASDADGAQGPALVIIDARVQDYESLLEGLDQNVTAIVVDTDASGVDAISQALDSLGQVGSLTIISHGQSGEIIVGSDTINAQALSNGMGDAVSSWADNLLPGADILLYGCDVAQGDAGYSFVQALADLTGADVAASTDATGALDRGGDWDLELVAGSIEASAPLAHAAMASYTGLLNDAPVVDAADTTLNYTENDGAVVIDASITLSDIDDTEMTGAVITVGSYVSGEDVLHFTNQNGITGTWDAGAGTMTLSGTASVADYQAALRSVTYENTSDTPTTGSFSITFEVTDANFDGTGAQSGSDARTISISAVNDAPVVDTSDTTLTYQEGSGAVAIDPGLLLSDPDDTQMTGAVVTIGSYVSGEDLLHFTDQNGISGTWDAGAGTMTLTGDASVADYQAALRSITYENISEDPTTGSMTVSFQVTDGNADGLGAETGSGGRTVTVTALNDAPVLSSDATLTPVGEDVSTGANSGTSVADLVASATYSDADSADPKGIAITGSDEGHGTWQYSTDGGSTWIDLGARTESSALLLASSAANMVRFLPDANYSGTASLTIRAWDQTEGTDGAAFNITATGGTTAFSADSHAATITITSINDSPIMTEAGTFASLSEDPASNPGVTVAAFLGSTVSDAADGNTDIGLAVTGVNTASINGVWQYNSGSGWTNFPSDLAADKALLLGHDVLIRFVPEANENGTTTLSYKAWDESSGATGDRVNPGAGGGGSAFSANSATASLGVSPVNDDPVMQHNTKTMTENHTGAQASVITSAELQYADPSLDAEQTPDQLVYELTDLPDHGRVELKIGTQWVELGLGSLFSQEDVDNGNIRYVYTGGELSAQGTDGFDFILRDGAGSEVTGSMAITVNEANDAVTFTNTTISVNEWILGDPDGTNPFTIGVSDGDAAPADITFTINDLSGLEYGFLWLDNGNGAYDAGEELSVGSTFTLADLNNGLLHYQHDGTEITADGGAAADDTFLVNVADGRGSTVTGQLITLNIQPRNDAPTLTNAGLTVPEGSVDASISNVILAATDVDSNDNQLTYTITTNVAHGWLELDGVRLGVGSTFQQIDIDLGHLTYTHDGTPTTADSFKFDLRDGDGAVVQGETFAITVTGVNDAPEIDINEGVWVQVGNERILTTSMLSGIDEESGPTELKYTWTGLDSNLVIVVDGNASATSFTQAQLTAGLVVIRHTDGSVTSDSTNTITITLDDQESFLPPGNKTDVETFSIHVYVTPGPGTNHTPWLDTNEPLEVLEDNSGGTVHNTITQDMLWVRDTDDTPGELVYTITDIANLHGTLYLNSVALGLNGTFTQADIDNGLVTYDNDGEEFTAASFGFTVSDGADASGVPTSVPDITDTFQIIITPVNDPPVLETHATITVAEQDADGHNGDEFLDDATNAQVLTIDAIGPNPSHLNWADVDNSDPLQMVFDITQAPTHGTLCKWDTTLSAWITLTADSTFSVADVAAGRVAYFHNADAEPDGSSTIEDVVDDSFSVQLTDGGATPSGEVTINVYVNNVNDPPTATGGRFAIDEGGSQIINSDSTHMSVADPDANDTTANLKYVITGLASYGTLYLDANDNDQFDSGEAVALNAVLTHAQVNSGNLQYVHNGSENFEDSFTFKARDDDGLESSDATVEIDIRPQNDDPTIIVNQESHVYEGGTLIIQTGTVDDTTTDGSNLKAYDPDNVATQVQFRIIENGNGNVDHGYLFLDTNGNQILDAGEKVLGVGSVFTLDDLNNNRLVYQHDGSEPVTPDTQVDKFDFKVSDSGGGNEPEGTFVIRLDPSNDAPEITTPDPVVMNEDGSKSITGITVYDVDAAQGTGNVQLDLSVTYGTLTLSGSGATITNNGTGSVTVTGTVDAVNAILANGVTYQPAADHNNTRDAAGNGDKLVLNLSDLGNFGNGGVQTASASVDITINPINDAPVISGFDSSDNPTYTEGAGHGVAGTPEILDSDATIADLDIAYPEDTYAGATLTLSREGSAVASDLFDVSVAGDVSKLGNDLVINSTTIATITTQAGGVITITFNAAADATDVNTVLQNITYSSTSDALPPTLNVKAVFNDGNASVNPAAQGTGGGLTASAVLTVNTIATNDSPNLSAGGTLTNIVEDVTDGANTGTTVATLLGRATGDDPDEVPLKGIAITGVNNTDGTWQYSTDGGSTWTAIDAATITGTGPLLLSTAAGNAVRFIPSPNFNGTATFSYRAWDTSDGATSGAYTSIGVPGGDTAYSATEQDATITVTPVNDAPVLTPATFTVDAGNTQENNPITISTAWDVYDLDLDTLLAVHQDNGTDLVQITMAASAGTINLTTTTGLSFVSGTANGQSTIVVRGTRVDLENALSSFTYTPGDDPTVNNDTITVTLNDLGNVGGGNLTDASVIEIHNIKPVNDAPTITAPANASVNEDSVITFTNITLADPDVRTGVISVSLSVPGGTGSLTLHQTTGLGGDTDGSDGTLNFTGTLADVNAALNGLQYRPSTDQNIKTIGGTVSLAIHVDDQGYGEDGSTGASLTADQTVAITVNQVNDAPIIHDMGGTVVYTEGGGSGVQGTPVILDADATISDTDIDQIEDTYDGATITVQRQGGAVAKDYFDVDTTGGVTKSGSNVLVGVSTVGTITTQANGVLTITFNAAATGSDVDAVLQHVTFTSSADDVGDITVQTTFNDGNAAQNAGAQGSGGGLTATGTVNITTTDVNDAPTLTAGGTLTNIIEDVTSGANTGTTVATLLGTATGTDPDGGGLVGMAITAVDNTNGTWQFTTDGGTTWTDINTAALSGTGPLHLNNTATNALRFTPNANYNGTATITYRAWDTTAGPASGNYAAVAGTGGTTAYSTATQDATLAVTPQNDAPSLGGSTGFSGTVAESADPNTGTAWQALVTSANVTDIDLSTTAAINGTTFGDGQITVSITGGAAYDSLRVNTALLTGSALPVGVTVSGGAAGADLVIELAQGTTLTQVNELLEAIEYQCTSDTFAGDRNIAITVSDGNNVQAGGNAGGPAPLSASLSATVTVSETNDPPAGGNQTVTVNEDAAYTFTAADFNFTSPGGETDTMDGVRIDTLPASGTLWIDANGDGIVNAGDTTLSAGDTVTQAQITGGQLKFRADADENGAGYAGFTFSVRDNRGAYDTAPNTMTVDVTPQNDAPTLGGATGFSGTIVESSVTGTGTGWQALVSGANVGDIDLTTTAGLAAGTFGDGQITVSITGGAAYDSLRVNTALLTGSALPVGVTVSGGASGADLVIELAQGTTRAQINELLEAVEYQCTSDAPPASRAVAITLSDGNNVQAGGNAGGPAPLATTLNATVNITNSNDTPDAQDDTDSTTQTAAVTRVASAGLIDPNDTDPDNDPLTVIGVVAGGGGASTSGVGTAVAGSSGGRLTVNADGSYTFDPNGDFNWLAIGASTTTSFDYTISDGHGGTDTATLTVTVNGTNDPPVATDDVDATDPTTVITHPAGDGVIINDTDAEGDALNVTEVNGVGGNVGSAVAGDNGGLFTINVDGSYTFDPNGDFDTMGAGGSEETSVTYTIADVHGQTSTATFTVTVSLPPLPVSDPGPDSTPVIPGVTVTPGGGGGGGGGGGSGPLGGTGGGGGGGGSRGTGSGSGIIGGDTLPQSVDRFTGYIAEIPHLFLTGTVEDRIFLMEESQTFTVPRDIFRHTDPSEKLSFEASLPDGSPLPGWLVFDPENLTFSGIPPRGAHSLDILVIARDTMNNEARAQFHIDILNEQVARPQGDQQGQDNGEQGQDGQQEQGDGEQGGEQGDQTLLHQDVLHLVAALAGTDQAEPQAHMKDVLAAQGKASLSSQVAAAGSTAIMAEAQLLLASFQAL